MIDDNIALLNQLVDQADETMAAIVADVQRDMPPADHPMWKRLARAGKCKPTESPADSILNAPGGTQAPVAECLCRPDDLVPGLAMKPAVDLTTNTVRCKACGHAVPRSCRTKKVRWLRGIAELHHHHPTHVDVAGLQAGGWLL